MESVASTAGKFDGLAGIVEAESLRVAFLRACALSDLLRGCVTWELSGRCRMCRCATAARCRRSRRTRSARSHGRWREITTIDRFGDSGVSELRLCSRRGAIRPGCGGGLRSAGVAPASDRIEPRPRARAAARNAEFMAAPEAVQLAWAIRRSDANRHGLATESSSKLLRAAAAATLAGCDCARRAQSGVVSQSKSPPL